MSDTPPPGIARSVRGLAETLLATAHNRAELAATEIELAARQAAQRLIWTLFAAGTALLALLMASLVVLVAAWETHRLMAAVGLTLLYAALALAAWLYARRIARRAPALLSGTLEELRRDADRLRGRS